MERYRKMAREVQKPDSPILSAESSAEEVLDTAVQCTFPASDPISIEVAFKAARQRELSRKSHGPR